MTFDLMQTESYQKAKSCMQNLEVVYMLGKENNS